MALGGHRPAMPSSSRTSPGSNKYTRVIAGGHAIKIYYSDLIYVRRARLPPLTPELFSAIIGTTLTI